MATEQKAPANKNPRFQIGQIREERELASLYGDLPPQSLSVAPTQAALLEGTTVA
jgi:hypothetical protein